MDDRFAERHARELERLERKRQALNQQFEARRAHVNAHFDEKIARVAARTTDKQTQIVNAALELLQEDGLNNLSLRDIARRIHTHAPAIYWYFKNKESLIDYLAEAILDKELHDAQPCPPDESWEDWLVLHMKKLRKAMLAYPDGGRVVAGAHLYLTVSLGKSLEYILVSVRGAGMNVHQAALLAATVTDYTFGHVIEQQSAPSAEEFEEYRPHVRNVFTEFPNLMDVVMLYRNTPGSQDDTFEAGLRLIIGGAAADFARASALPDSDL